MEDRKGRVHKVNNITLTYPEVILDIRKNREYLFNMFSFDIYIIRLCKTCPLRTS